MSRTSLEVIPRWSQRASMPAQLLDVGEEGDDVVLRRALDLVDARRVERDLLRADAPRAVPRGTSSASSIASHAASSTSSHVR